MGHNARKKLIRKAQKSQHFKSPPPSDAQQSGNLTPTIPSCAATPTSSPDHPNLNPNPNPNLNDDLSEAQLEDILFKKLDIIYSKIPVSPPPESSLAFSNRRLQEHDVNAIVTVIRHCRPKLTRRQALWCFLMSNLDINVACLFPLPGGEDDDDIDCLRSMKQAYFLNQTTSFRSDSTDSQESGDVDTIVQSLERMSINEEETLEEVADHEKEEMIHDLILQICNLQEQVKGGKDWAQQKAIQAARKLSNNLNELTVLSMELKEENEALVEDDVAAKRLSEMVSELKMMSGEEGRLNREVQMLNREVQMLEKENAEIRAELEAEKLNASESEKALMEVAMREKKYQKRLLVMEKQRETHEEEVAQVRKEIMEIQQELDEVLKAQKETKVKLREEQRAKVQAIALVEEELKAKEAADVGIKRKHEALQRETELDFQHHMDDINRLENELSHLQALAGSTELNPSSSNLCSGDTDTTKMLNEASGMMLEGLNTPPGLSMKNTQRGKMCLICLENEVSVVFLPCAHQLLCTSCNNNHERWADGICPRCFIPIGQRIHVQGVSS